MTCGASGGTRAGRKFTTDLNVSYTLFDRYTLTVGGSNVFNTYPDRVASTAANPIYTLTGGTLDGQIYPRTGGPFGMNGAFWWASLNVQFK